MRKVGAHDRTSTLFVILPERTFQQHECWPGGGLRERQARASEWSAYVRCMSKVVGRCAVDSAGCPFCPNTWCVLLPFVHLCRVSREPQKKMGRKGKKKILPQRVPWHEAIEAMLVDREFCVRCNIWRVPYSCWIVSAWLLRGLLCTIDCMPPSLIRTKHTSLFQVRKARVLRTAPNSYGSNMDMRIAISAQDRLSSRARKFAFLQCGPSMPEGLQTKLVALTVENQRWKVARAPPSDGRHHHPRTEETNRAWPNNPFSVLHRTNLVNLQSRSSRQQDTERLRRRDGSFVLAPLPCFSPAPDEKCSHQIHDRDEGFKMKCFTFWCLGG